MELSGEIIWRNNTGQGSFRETMCVFFKYIFLVSFLYIVVILISCSILFPSTRSVKSGS